MIKKNWAEVNIASIMVVFDFHWPLGSSSSYLNKMLENDLIFKILALNLVLSLMVWLFWLLLKTIRVPTLNTKDTHRSMDFSIKLSPLVLIFIYLFILYMNTGCSSMVWILWMLNFPFGHVKFKPRESYPRACLQCHVMLFTLYLFYGVQN